MPTAARRCETLALFVHRWIVHSQGIYPALLNICTLTHRCTSPSASMTNLPGQSPQRVEYLHKCRQENRFKKCHTQSHLIDDRKCFKRDLQLQFGAISCGVSVFFSFIHGKYPEDIDLVRSMSKHDWIEFRDFVYDFSFFANLKIDLFLTEFTTALNSIMIFGLSKPQ